MSSYSTYEQGERRREQERASAPKQCPHCKTPINQDLGRWDKPRYHCGSDKCRKAASRQGIAERKRLERSASRAQMLHYCNEQLDHDQRQAVMEMVDLAMAYDYDNGHNVARAVVQVDENKRCKHDRIAELEANATLWQRRAEASERQLKDRIEELEAELALFNALHNTIHNIATEQLRKQPDPQARQPSATEAEPEDPDRAQVLATLALAGLKPYTGQQDPDDDEEDQEQDDMEQGNYEDEDDPEE